MPCGARYRLVAGLVRWGGMALYAYSASSMMTCGVRVMFSAINRLLDATPSTAWMRGLRSSADWALSRPSW